MSTTPNNFQRICIYPKDVQIITGKSGSYARRMVNKIKARFDKSGDQVITIQEFCEYLGLNEELVAQRLRL